MVGEVDCNIFIFHTKTDTEEKYWISKDASRVIQVTLTADSPMGKIPMSMQLTDYKQVEQIWYAHTMDIQQGTQKMQMIIEGFDGAIWCSGGDVQALADAIDGLMVPGSDEGVIAVEDTCEPAAAVDVDLVEGRTTERYAVSEPVTHSLRQMRDERAAEGDIQDLRATADAQPRELSLHSVVRQGQFAGIAITVDHVHGFVLRPVVARWIEVTTAG